jgi:hypothetical protein
MPKDEILIRDLWNEIKQNRQRHLTKMGKSLINRAKDEKF